MPDMTIDERRRALYPELFMSADERAAANSKLTAEMKATATMTVENQLGAATDHLWQVVAPEAIDAATKKYFDLSNTSHGVEYGLPNNPQVKPIIHVEVVKDAGEALKDTADWEKSALQNAYVPVELHRYSRPFALYNNDIMRGERIATKLTAAVEAVVCGVVNDYLATVKNASGALSETVSADLFTPEYVAHNISALFGEFGGVDDLVLSPELYAKLVPTNALSLGTAPGTYGIGEIHSTAGLNMTPAEGSALASTEGLKGFAVRRNGIAAGFGVPSFEGLQGISVRSLGTVAGVPLVLKSWLDPAAECIWNSVEAMAGFTVANAAGICKLTAAASQTDEEDGE